MGLVQFFPRGQLVSECAIACILSQTPIQTFGPEYVQLGEARGDVLVPPDKDVLLSLGYPKGEPASFDLAPLAALKDRDLQGVDLRWPTRLRSGQLTYLRGLAGLRWLGLGGEHHLVTDAIAHQMGMLTCLEGLDLGSNPLSGRGIGFLQELTDLRFLSLRKTRLCDDDLFSLSSMTRLDALLLSNTGITGKGLAYLAAHPTINNLDLAGCKKLEELRYIPLMEHLTELDLSQSGVTNSGLSHLARCANLRTLKLVDTGIGDAGLVHIGHCANLVDLDLSNTAISDDGLTHVGRCENLVRLCVGSTAISDPGLGHLRSLTHLESLHLSDTRVTDRGLALLAPLSELTRLDLCWAGHVTDSGLMHLQALPKLDQLWLAGPQVARDSLEALSVLPGLRTLYLIHAQATSADIAWMRQARPDVAVYPHPNP